MRRKLRFTMATITKASVLSKAREMALSQLSIGGDEMYQTGTGAFDFLVDVEMEGKTFEVPITVKVTAHDYQGTASRPAYDMFQAHEDYKAEVAAREDKARARAEKKEADAKAREAKRAARLSKSKASEG